MSSIASEVSICNGALTLLGDNPIVALNDGSQQAQNCSIFYAEERDSLLRDHIWTFAKTRAALAALNITDPLNEFTNAYQLPPDFLRYVYSNLPYGYIYSIEGSTLWVNVSSIAICYIRRVTDPTTFDPLFVPALEARLAWKLALGSTAKVSLAKTLHDLHNERVLKAKQANGIENYPDVIDAWDLVYPRNLGSLATTGPKIWVDPLY